MALDTECIKNLGRISLMLSVASKLHLLSVTMLNVVMLSVVMLNVRGALIYATQHT
jgi:hypothetical protein